ncbi:hypothetical protein ABQF44_19275 [Mycolicibacterium porcinum]
MLVSGDIRHRVAEEQLHAPSHWKSHSSAGSCRHFGPVSSLFDFLTFGLMLGILDAGPGAVPHRMVCGTTCQPDIDHLRDPDPPVPFLRSMPGTVLVVTTAAVIIAGIAITVSPLAEQLGFTPLPWQIVLALVLPTVEYLVLVEITKTAFCAEPVRLAGTPPHTRGHAHRVNRRAARFSNPHVPEVRTSSKPAARQSRKTR